MSFVVKTKPTCPCWRQFVAFDSTQENKEDFVILILWIRWPYDIDNVEFWDNQTECPHCGQKAEEAADEN